MNSSLGLILIVGLVAVLALWMRRSGQDEVADVTATPIGEPEPEDLPDDEADGPIAPDAPVLVTSEGIALMVAGTQVRLVDLAGADGMPEGFESGIRASSIPHSVVARVYGRIASESRGYWSGSTLHAADFTAVRVRRDASGSWHLETLGRDGDFGYLPFDTERGARAAMELVEDLQILRRPLDEDGEPVASSPEDFEEARRRYEETERDLAITPDDDEPPPSADWSSRR